MHRFGNGDGDGPAVVAVHGITGNGQAWRVVGRALAGQARLLAVDLRGRGQSRELPGPYGLDAHVRDLLAVLDAHDLGRPVFVGHSLGAYIVARLGARHPDRVSALVLVDGGLRIPGSQVEDPQAFLDAFLGVTLARLALRFATPEDYYDWWRAHPALVDSDVRDPDLQAYADNDLVGAPPELRSAAREEAVRQDGADVLLGDDDAGRLTVPATLLSAPFGLQGEPNPMQPVELVRTWVDGRPELRIGRQVPGVNHYTIVLGTAGAAAVADAVRGVV
ncbi:MAG TPA: alpha/beta fold hydrolase [Solirubrobacteraceae bacterium]|nr:alpha/beta fold hydrolase [Solirubrobacteraceae bacterium]